MYTFFISPCLRNEINYSIKKYDNVTENHFNYFLNLQGTQNPLQGINLPRIEIGIIK